MIPTTKADRLIRENRELLTRQQIRTLRGQIRSGNEEAALRGIERIIKRKEECNDRF